MVARTRERAVRAPAEVVHLSSAHHPLDPRIHHRECRSLARAGFRVTQIAPGLEEGEVDGVRIRTVPPARGRGERVTRTVTAVFRAAREEPATLFHLHDPELIAVGLWLKVRGARVIYDVHEDLPRQVLDKEWIPSHALRRLAAVALGPVEALIGSMVDGVVAASPEIAERFRAEKTAVVRNFVRLELVDAVDPWPDAPGRPVAIYPGSLTEVRGIPEIVTAMEHLAGRVELWLMGSWGTSTVEDTCRNLPGWEYTRYLGRRPLEEVYRRMKTADIGLHVPHAVGGYSSGLAMKGFEYMASRLPMVMTDEPAKRRTFGECALFADPRDPEAIADRIRRLLDHPVEARTLAQRGRELVENRYSWENEESKLLGLYGRVLG